MRKQFWALIAALALMLAGAAQAQPGQYHGNLFDESPTVLAAPGALDAAQAEADETAEAQAGFQIPWATVSQRGCATQQIPVNWSSRSGADPALLVLHYTVSSNRDGWSDVAAIRGWFSQSRAQASSNYIIDFEGHCSYIVPETAKAWTQGYFNPWSISIEFIATGSERTWPNAGLRKGATVFADAAKRWGIPLRWARVSGCTIVRSGILDHETLDCGNHHTDVQPHFPYAKFMRYVREAAAPQSAVRFQVRGPGGDVLTQSARVAEGSGEHGRLAGFLTNVAGSHDHLGATLQRLRQHGYVRVHRAPSANPAATSSTASGRVQFQLRGSGGQILSRSATVREGPAEYGRLDQFLRKIAREEGLRQAALQRMRKMGHVLLVRA